MRSCSALAAGDTLTIITDKPLLGGSDVTIRGVNSDSLIGGVIREARERGTTVQAVLGVSATENHRRTKDNAPQPKMRRAGGNRPSLARRTGGSG